MTSERDIYNKIANALRTSGFTFQKDVAVGGTVGDFYVLAPSGSSALFEVKSWQPTSQNQERASNLASLYKDVSGADNAFVVLPGLSDNKPDSGVVSAGKFVEFMDTYLTNAPKSAYPHPPEVRAKPSKIIFAAMPFAEKYDDTFVVAMQSAALDVGANCLRVDHTQFTGDIVREIKRLIQDCVAVVADLSDSRPNVLYEIGIAEALERPIIQICSPDDSSLPFDVRNNKTIFYSIGQTAKLRPKLAKALRGIVV